MQREGRRRSTRYTAVGERGRRTGIDAVAGMSHNNNDDDTVRIGEYFNKMENNQPFMNEPNDFPDDFRIENDSNTSLMSLSSSNDGHNVSKSASLSTISSSHSKSINYDPLSALLSASIQLLSANGSMQNNPETSFHSDETNNEKSDHQEQVLLSDEMDQHLPMENASPDDKSMETPKSVKPPTRQIRPLFARFMKAKMTPAVERLQDNLDENIDHVDNNDHDTDNNSNNSIDDDDDDADDDNSPFIDHMSYTSSTPLPAQSSSYQALEHSPINNDLNEIASPSLPNIPDEVEVYDDEQLLEDNDYDNDDDNADEVSSKGKEPMIYNNHDMDIYDDQSDHAENAIPTEAENIPLTMDYSFNDNHNHNLDHNLDDNDYHVHNNSNNDDDGGDTTNEFGDSIQPRGQVIIPIDTNGNGKVGRIQTNTGVRRSTRRRIPPLAYWRNERQILSMGVVNGQKVAGVAGVVRVPESPVTHLRSQKKKTISRTIVQKKLKKAGLKVSENPEIEVIQDNEITVKKLLYIGNIPKVKKTDTGFYHHQTFTHNNMNCGIIELAPNGEKPNRNSGDSTYTFSVTQGTCQITIHQTTLVLCKGDQVMVPKGNQYQIKNVSRGRCQLFYAKTQ
ncbi:Mif2/CENP-C like-domain-containing protein [Syncephalis plumigaleata]|nr:Mif2/CENP-C like-domain-containing protein [Syncephalis plumigaleata]